jgi:hypothetical protein
MIPQHGLTVRFVLYKTARLKKIGGFEPSRKATDPRKKIQGFKSHDPSGTNQSGRSTSSLQLWQTRADQPLSETVETDAQ